MAKAEAKNTDAKRVGSEKAMRKVKLLVDLDTKKAGWGVEMSDETAAILVAQGRAEYLPADAPLKKGNLDLYDGCIPVPYKIAGAQKSAAAPKQQTNTNTIKE